MDKMERDNLAFELEEILALLSSATTEQFRKLEFLIKQLRETEG